MSDMANLTQPELEHELNSRLFHPVYLLLGPEEFLRHHALIQLKRTVLAPEAFAFNYSEFRFPVAHLKDVLISAETFPFASPHRLVVAKELEAMPTENQGDLAEYLRRPSSKTVLVLDASEMDRRTTFYRTLREKACVVEYPNLKGAALEKWTEQFIRGKGLRIASSALKKLIYLAGSDLQALSAEIEKLALYVGAEKVIPDTAVADLVLASRQHGIFELTGAIGKRDWQGALRLLANLIESGEAPLGIVAMIARHFRQIMIAKELLDAGRPAAEIGAAAQIPPFILEDFLRQARAFDWATAQKVYERLSAIDLAIKSSRVDPRVLLENLICSI